jgi:AraC-like DNA-binding protein
MTRNSDSRGFTRQSCPNIAGLTLRLCPSQCWITIAALALARPRPRRRSSSPARACSRRSGFRPRRRFAPGGRTTLAPVGDAAAPAGPDSQPVVRAAAQPLTRARGPSPAGPSPAAGARPIAQAVELMRERLAHPWTVTELGAKVSLSVRSLQERLPRSLDATPMAYLRHLRLEKVHEELGTAAPGTVVVTQVAARWGVVYLGRFAAAYRREFAERPSEATQSARPHTPGGARSPARNTPNGSRQSERVGDHPEDASRQR